MAEGKEWRYFDRDAAMSVLDEIFKTPQMTSLEVTVSADAESFPQIKYNIERNLLPGNKGREKRIDELVAEKDEWRDACIELQHKLEEYESADGVKEET